MKKQLNHIKEQLKLIKETNNLDYSKGVVDALLTYIELETPLEVSLKIKTYGNLIHAIKAVRQELGIGLADAKELVENYSYVYKGSDIDYALGLKKRLEAHMGITFEGSKTAGLLFNKETV